METVPGAHVVGNDLKEREVVTPQFSGVSVLAYRRSPLIYTQRDRAVLEKGCLEG